MTFIGWNCDESTIFFLAAQGMVTEAMAIADAASACRVKHPLWTDDEVPYPYPNLWTEDEVIPSLLPMLRFLW
jgi:hypothetical protein